MGVSYDNQNDILYFNEGEVVDSLDFGNIFLEFSAENNVVGVEILKASETLSDLMGRNISDRQLKQIEKARIKTIPKDDTVFIVLKLEIPEKGETVEESINLNFSSEAVA